MTVALFLGIASDLETGAMISLFRGMRETYVILLGSRSTKYIGRDRAFYFVFYRENMRREDIKDASEELYVAE